VRDTRRHALRRFDAAPKESAAAPRDIEMMRRRHATLRGERVAGAGVRAQRCVIAADGARL